MIPNKKTRAYISLTIALLITWFIEFKHLEIFNESWLSIILQALFGLVFFAFCSAGLIYTFNKIANYFGYEE